MLAADGRCDSHVTVIGPCHDRAGWAEVWAAAVAANEMCGKGGRLGLAYD